MADQVSTWPRVLVDASNLVVGGGVQVAASLIDELCILQRDRAAVRQHPILASIEYRVSPAVLTNLTSEMSTEKIRVAQTKWSQPTVWAGRRSYPYDLQLTVFGPRYGRRLAPVTITGLADVTSVYSWPRGLPRGSIKARAKRVLRGQVARVLFRRESLLVSESASLLEEYRLRTGYPLAAARVIPNSVSRAVSDPSRHEPLGRDLREMVGYDTILLAYVARPYPHKNHGFLPRVRALLQAQGMNVRFVVTLSDQEWQSSPDDLREACINVGVVSITQVADLNSQCDGAIFPSLLESFSATPIETIVMDRPLFASDRPFVKEVCRGAAAYFDPLDPQSAAEQIRRTFGDQAELDRLKASRIDLRATLSTPEARALRYLELIEKALLAPEEQLRVVRRRRDEQGGL